MPIIESTLLGKLLDILIFILTGGLIFVFRKLFQLDKSHSEHDTQIALCRQRDHQSEIRRHEERELREQQRKEMLAKIDSHHQIVMKKLDTLLNHA